MPACVASFSTLSSVALLHETREGGNKSVCIPVEDGAFVIEPGCRLDRSPPTKYESMIVWTGNLLVLLLGLGLKWTPLLPLSCRSTSLWLTLGITSKLCHFLLFKTLNVYVCVCVWVSLGSTACVGIHCHDLAL